MDTPPLPKAFASVTGLGAPKRYFSIKKFQRAVSLTALIVFLIGSILILLYGLYVTYLAVLQHGPAMIDDNLVWPTIIALALFLLGLAVSLPIFTNRKKGVALFEEGFAVRDRKGILSWHWEDVAALTAAVTRHHLGGIYTGTTHVYTLYNEQNERVVLKDSYAKVEELAGTIEERIFPILYSRAVDQYNAGQTLVFGPVAVSKGEIRIGKKTYPWTEVEQVSIRRGSLKIAKKDGGWFSGAGAATASISNLRVLLAIVQQMIGVKVG